MDFLSQTMVALRGPTGAPQTPAETIARLSDRLSPATLLADRRAAVFALKGLSRDCKQDVGDRALSGLLEVLVNDAELDVDIAKAVLDTLNVLCEAEERDAAPGSKELGFKHTDQVLASEKAVHTLFSLLSDTSFYTRFSTLQFLSTLLLNRRQVVQGYFLKAPNGAASVNRVLEDKREIIRNETIGMVQSLVSQSPDIQKILAFEGAFEKLMNTITQEDGIEGGVVVHDALKCVYALLHYNTSNQSYFRETSLPPNLPTLLLFPPDIALDTPAPQEFSLQLWDKQKLDNATLVVAIMGMFLGSKGNVSQELFAYTRCFIELGLASNAPTPLKAQALRLLPAHHQALLSELSLTPYIPVPDTNGEEWDRLEPASALDTLVELVLHGEYNGIESGRRTRDCLELRGVAVSVFENFVRKEDIRVAIMQGMVPTEDSSPPSVTPLLHCLISPPSSPLDPAAVTSTQLATLLFSHLLRSSPKSKSLALSIIPSVMPPDPDAGQQGTFFVPADSATQQIPTRLPPVDDEEPTQTLLQTLTENLSLAFLSRSRGDSSERELREWERLVVAYLCLLSQWLWEDPKAVRAFLDSGGLGMLMEPINQNSAVDAIVPGLCAFLLGICYEYNREPGEITRSTIHAILGRLSIETLSGRMARLREDERFKEVGPDSIVLSYPTPAHLQPGLKPESADETEIWFDWSFVDFWKSNYYAVQRALAADPNSLSSSASHSTESAMLIASLQNVIRTQAQEIEDLQKRLKEHSNGNTEVRVLKERVLSLSSQLQSSEEKRKEIEKEQEDLLVLLDEVTSKRRRDKTRLQGAGLAVSEDEGDDADDVAE